MPPLRIVDLEELDLDDDARVTHHGVLFTGVERSHHADGSLEWEACYDDGSRHGPCRRWLNRATSNALVYERYFCRGVAHGRGREWHDDLSPKLDGWFELGIVICQTSWDENGAQVTAYTIPAAGLQMDILVLRRHGVSAPGIVELDAHTMQFAVRPFVDPGPTL